MAQLIFLDWWNTASLLNQSLDWHSKQQSCTMTENKKET